MSDGFWVADADGRLRDVNDAYCQMLGYSRQDLLSMRIRDLETNESPAELDRHILAVRDKGTDRFETRHRCRDGRAIDVEVSITWMDICGGQVFAMVRDITDRIRAGHQIENLARFPSENPHPVLRIALDGSLLYANAAAEQVITGLSDNSCGRPPAEWIRVGRDALTAGTMRLIEIKQGKRIFSFSVVPVPNGQYANWYGRDVTDRRKAEQAALCAQQALLERQRRETELVEIELEKVREELVRSARLAAIGQVSASIAHDIRNPLGSVRNAAFYLKRHVPAERPELVEFLEIIEEQVETADRIISSLLEMTRTKTPRKADVDLSRLVADAFRSVKEAGGVCCHVMTAPDPFIFKADADQFRQVMVNLLQNSVQAMNGRGEIRVEATRQSDADEIIVRDTGPGVPANVRQTLFEPLVTTKVKGSGLGLVICRQVVEQHGGSISLAAEAQLGAVFCIRLPGTEQNRKSDQEAETT